ncbi:hypothetical protein BCR34DRAFT_608860 [Clohesyomyces aquaticus]|uniref:Uncharacterized protein n=1 Tax=Clohesyomyces aquaticus TaxID=1231657 RepID=A0A1Y1Y2K1_9PLEO|nr:hypothetical protein BCR34DRAFT_608860 [Clohesyomyces aquaticus]
MANTRRTRDSPYPARYPCTCISVRLLYRSNENQTLIHYYPQDANGYPTSRNPIANDNGIIPEAQFQNTFDPHDWPADTPRPKDKDGNEYPGHGVTSTSSESKSKPANKKRKT